MVRQHAEELENTSKDYLTIDTNQRFTLDTLQIFSLGVKNYTERSIMMDKGKRPVALTQYWKEEFEKLLTSIYEESELKYKLGHLYSILNFLDKVAQAFEYQD